METEGIAAAVEASVAFRAKAQVFPAGRVARPRAIADTMAFLASDRSAYTSGGLCAAV